MAHVFRRQLLGNVNKPRFAEAVGALMIIVEHGSAEYAQIIVYTCKGRYIIRFFRFPDSK